jgi:pantoate--beta-alanine ligase
MEVIHTEDLLTGKTISLREAGMSIGFVPTMGALHEGHLSLVRRSKSQNNFTVVSVFVNPTQFNDRLDLKKYPRMPEKDLDMLRTTGCDVVFMPDEKEIYPEPDTREFDFGGLDKVMEGKHRPGHFNGVAQVVTRLFDLVKPHRAYFGLKDFQQVTIIKKVITDLHYPVEIIPCPIVRDPDGLAMSSRNMLLNPEERTQALAISKTLFTAKSMKSHNTPEEVKQFVIISFHSSAGIELEYFDIIHGTTLQPVKKWESKGFFIGCVAARVGKIRLIDNIDFSS